MILGVSGIEHSPEAQQKSVIVSSDPRNTQKVIVEIGQLFQEAEDKLADGSFTSARGALYP
jgi:hypothetical protein